MSKSPPAHMPHLDALRALSIFLVFMEHFTPWLCHTISWGKLGVRCFFVLSGFLITGILLRSRALIEAGESSAGFQFRQFYIRRSLRIFPVYYLTLAVGCFLGMAMLQQTIWWQAAYLSNVLTAMQNAWPGYLSHLWSLSVEEQFYLLWPAVILLVPRRWLLPVIVGTVAVAPLLRGLLAAAWGPAHLGVYVLTPCCVDALGAGALLALWRHRGGELESVKAKRWIGAGALGIVGCTLLWPVISISYQVLLPVFESLFFVGVVVVAARGAQGRWGWLFNSPFLQYTGRISYGLYLYHLFVSYGLGMICDKLGLVKPTSAWVTLPIYLALTYAGATLSWLYLERPLNALKRFFPHEPKRTAAALELPPQAVTLASN